jgi:hypothetical protein
VGIADAVGVAVAVGVPRAKAERGWRAQSQPPAKAPWGLSKSLYSSSLQERLPLEWQEVLISRPVPIPIPIPIPVPKPISK